MHESLYIHNPCGIAVIDPGGVFLDANPRFTDLLGKPREEVVGRSCSDVLPASLSKVLSTVAGPGEKECPPARIRLFLEGGREVWLEFTCKEFSENGADLRALYVTDLTEQKRRERLRRDFERMARHDVKGPIQGVVGAAAILRTFHPDGEAARWVSMIEDSARDIMETLEAGLLMASLEEGSACLTFGETDLALCLDRVTRTLHLLAEDGKVELDWETSPPHQVIMAHSLLLGNMLLNLVKNAVEATPPKGRVLIRAQAGPEGLTISVTNPGELSDRARESFFRKYFTQGKPGGTGLGTHSALLVARAHGGDLRVSCEEGRITVTATFPPEILVKQDREGLGRAV